MESLFDCGHLLAHAVPIRSLNHLRQLHARLVLSSLDAHNFWVALLIRHCTRLRAPVAYSHLILAAAPAPDAAIFTNLLKYYHRAGAHRRALALFVRMHALHTHLDPFAYPALIKSSEKEFCFCPPLHAHILKCGHGTDRFIRNALIGMYSKHSPVEVARKLFDEMPDKAVADWNAMLCGYWSWGRAGEALLLFTRMPEKNVLTWNAMVTGYCRLGDLGSARRYFDAMPEKNTISWNALLSGYAQKGFVKDALKLFDAMTATMDGTGLQPDEVTVTSIISACASRGDLRIGESLARKLELLQVPVNGFITTALIDMYAKCGSLATAREIFNAAGIHHHQLDSSAWNAMISGYSRVGDLGSARELFDEMPQRNVVSWNSMIAGYAQNGQTELAIELFKEMILTSDPAPNEVTLLSVISACGHLGSLKEGRWVVNWLHENQWKKLSVSLQSSLIFMYSKCGLLKDAVEVFHEMPARDLGSYNTLIGGLAAHGHGREALRLLGKMEEEGIHPDRVTFISVLTACSHAGLVEEGLNVFESIETPTIDHYACVVDLLGRMGRLDKAAKLIETMPMEPHVGVYGSLLNACRLYKQIELGEFAARRLFELEPENPGNYVLLSNIYASTGRWVDVERNRELMEAKGLKKVVAHSWVEFSGKVHRFITGDRSHEKSGDIYRVLAELKKKMRAFGYEADKVSVLKDVEDEEKEEMVGTHSEKLAVAFALLVGEPGTMIQVVKNIRVCGDCHAAMKIISKLEGREILLRDNNRFHCFNDGQCSCGDYW